MDKMEKFFRDYAQEMSALSILECGYFMAALAAYLNNDNEELSNILDEASPAVNILYRAFCLMIKPEEQ